jgi:hypothetical protein
MFPAGAEAFWFVKSAQLIGNRKKPPIFCAESMALLERTKKRAPSFSVGRCGPLTSASSTPSLPLSPFRSAHAEGEGEGIRVIFDNQ